MVEAGHEKVYSYRFDWDDSGRLLFMNFKKMFGAAHGFEIPFVFNRFEHLTPSSLGRGSIIVASGPTR